MSAAHSAALAALNTGNFEMISAACDEIELEVGFMDSDWPYLLHLLGYLVKSDLVAARFLWKRIPDSAKQVNPELTVAWEVTKRMWNGEYEGIYSLLQAEKWSSDIKPMINALLESNRKHVLQLLSKAYTTISVAEAAVFLGLSQQEAVQVTAGVGWSVDPTNPECLVVRPLSEDKGESIPEQNLHQLTEYVVHLEA
mmetsp:Transcript_1274/g.1491  ORF Transcript_1274/g.1491 Transcript_1274/m.1491 type:complete len:197 (-) Transcript_1274:698-1288(-)